MSKDRAAPRRFQFLVPRKNRNQRIAELASRGIDLTILDSEEAPSIIPHHDPDQLPGHGRYGAAY